MENLSIIVIHLINIIKFHNISFEPHTLFSIYLNTNKYNFEAIKD